MKCIFCLEEREPSKEHVFPLAIGGLLTTDRVCKKCNSWLGTNVDAHLSDCSTIVWERHKRGLKGRNGKVPDPLNCFGTGTMSDGRKIKSSIDPRTKQSDLELLDSVKRNNDGTINISVDQRNIKRLPELINTVRMREGLNPLSSDEMRELLRTVTAGTVEQPCVVHDVKAFDFRPALFKIAYELAFLWFGESYVLDPMATTLRSVIRNEADIEIIRSAFEIGNDITAFHLWPTMPDLHIAYNAHHDEDIIINIRIFGAIGAHIVVSEARSHYFKNVIPQAEAQFVSIDTVKKTLERSSLFDAVSRIAKDMLATRLSPSS